MIINLDYLESRPEIRHEDVPRIIEDIYRFNGWIRCSTSMPVENMYVQVTDGEFIGQGIYLEVAKEWLASNVYSPMRARNIIAWRLLPEIPKKLIEKCKPNG